VIEHSIKTCFHFEGLNRHFNQNPGANPTIVSFNAASSLVRFENKIVFFYFEKTL
jgi:hypothetical protein